MMTSTSARVVSFAFVGAVGTLMHYLTLVVLVEVFDTSPTVATTAGFVVGAIVNYALNYRYTFRSAKSHLDAGPKFFACAILSGCVNTAIVAVGVSSFNGEYLLVQLIATGAVFALNFLLNSEWTFRPNPGDRL
jgi:putative flippase GtrA